MNDQGSFTKLELADGDPRNASYDAAHPDDTLVLSGPSTILEAKNFVEREGNGFLSLGLFSSMHILFQHGDAVVSFRRPVINGRSLEEALFAGNPDKEEFGLIVHFRTQTRKVLRSLFFEGCRVNHSSLNVSCSLVEEGASVKTTAAYLLNPGTLIVNTPLFKHTKYPIGVT